MTASAPGPASFFALFNRPVLKKMLGISLLLALLALACLPAQASPITWITWNPSSVVTGNSGSASGAIGSVSVSYSGQVFYFYTNFPSWGPSTSYVGGTVGNAPSPNEIIGLTGGSAIGTETISFSAPVVDPVMAIWSLGQAGDTADFIFNASEPFTIEAGGPSSEYGGSSIYSCYTHAVCGAEGNGTIQFDGTFSSLTFTIPAYENWYGFDLGIAGVASATTPEPATLLLLATGLFGLALLRRRRASHRSL